MKKLLKLVLWCVLAYVGFQALQAAAMYNYGSALQGCMQSISNSGKYRAPLSPPQMLAWRDEIVACAHQDVFFLSRWVLGKDFAPEIKINP